MVEIVEIVDKIEWMETDPDEADGTAMSDGGRVRRCFRRRGGDSGESGSVAGRGSELRGRGGRGWRAERGRRRGRGRGGLDDGAEVGVVEGWDGCNGF